MQVGSQEAAQLLGIKPHVLRYWEQEIPLIAPQRDAGGRKVYRDQDMRILYRVRHLVVDRKYTLQGALDQILAEATPEQAPRKAALEGLRGELLSLRDRVSTHREAVTAARAESPGAAPDSPGAVRDSPAAGEEPLRSAGGRGHENPAPRGAATDNRDAEAEPAAADLIAPEEVAGTGPNAGRRPWALKALSPDRLVEAPDGPPRISIRPRGEREDVYFGGAAEEMVRRGELLVVSASHLFLSAIDGKPPECHPLWPQSRRSLLGGSVARARAVAYRLGRPFPWINLLWARDRGAVEKELAGTPEIYRPELLAVPGDEIGALDEPHRLLGSSPYATLIGYLSSLRQFPSLIQLSSLEEISSPLLDLELLSAHLSSGRRATARACDRGGGRWRLSGTMIFSVEALREGWVPLEPSTRFADSSSEKRQVALAALFASLGGVAIPTAQRCLRPTRYDRHWPEEMEELLALRFRTLCEQAGWGPLREVDPLFAETAEELSRRRKGNGDSRGTGPGKKR